MRTFDDIRKELKEENIAEYISLEIMGGIMSERVRQGLSQRELASRTGVSQKTISRLENGLDNPSLETLAKLARALGLAMKLVDIDSV